jgi:hypothetical protein
MEWNMSQVNSMVDMDMLKELVDDSAYRALGERVRQMTSLPTFAMLLEKACEGIAPTISKCRGDLEVAFPGGRLTGDLSVYNDSLGVGLDLVAVEAQTLACGTLNAQAGVIGKTCVVLQQVHSLAQLDVAMHPEYGIPEAVRVAFARLWNASTPVRACVNAPGYLTSVFRAPLLQHPGDLSHLVPAAVVADTLAMADRAMEKTVSDWADFLVKTSEELQSVTPVWQLHSTDIWSPAAKAVLLPLIESPAWAWPTPEALPKHALLHTVHGQAKRMNKEVGNSFSAATLKDSKTVLSHTAETSALAYALHVLVKILPKLDAVELKKTAATTLRAQVLSKHYQLPEGIMEAISQAAETGVEPKFRDV